MDNGITATEKATRDLKELFDGQKELSADNQALLELGVVSDSLQLSDMDYVIRFLFKTNKEAVAKQARADIALIKGKLEKEKKTK